MELVYIGLSTFAFVFLLKYTDGPFDIFLKLRVKAGLYLPVYLEDTDEVIDYLEDIDPERFWALWFKCFWCMSTWVSFVFSAAYILVIGVTIWLFPFLWLSSLGVSGVLLELINRWRE